MNELTNERTNERMNKRKKEQMKEEKKERKNERTKERSEGEILRNYDKKLNPPTLLRLSHHSMSIIYRSRLVP